jgi:hypothetical protein
MLRKPSMFFKGKDPDKLLSAGKYERKILYQDSV